MINIEDGELLLDPVGYKGLDHDNLDRGKRMTFSWLLKREYSHEVLYCHSESHYFDLAACPEVIVRHMLQIACILR